MEPFISELLNALGKSIDSTDVQALIRRYELTDEYSDPPFRHYVGSSAQGIDLLFEDGHLIAVQIFTEATKDFAAFEGPLPFGIRRDMSQLQVHELLGQAIEADEFDSKFAVSSTGAKLVVNYGGALSVRYLNILAPKQA
ncbi:hypothetical protein [Rhodanobacter sp. C03]|uniref:hypothetical protein n=1 Tax=Rhodanobacter sp. C03 TaxID=1945858 RepID=UPI000984C8D5|nr:hypothetical protein [Rhodanobacter sp. C03]OOG60286.1 hypothetical protein B0E48_05975 [Rhodanobacter sp. C03]